MKRIHHRIAHILGILLVAAVLAIVGPSPAAQAAAAGCPDGWAERQYRDYRDSAGRLAARLYEYRYHRDYGDPQHACFGLRLMDYYRTIATGFTRIRVCNEFRQSCEEDSGTNVYYVGPIFRPYYYGNDTRSTLYTSSGKLIMDDWTCLCG